jgi:hypothetical protein
VDVHRIDRNRSALRKSLESKSLCVMIWFTKREGGSDEGGL